jgi:hypothetical protein
MKQLLIVLCLLSLASCAGMHNRSIVRSGVLCQGINRQAFLDVWGSPERTRVLVIKDEQESISFGWHANAYGGGGGLFKGRQSHVFQEWNYEKIGISLLFDGATLVDWKTDKSVEQLKAIAH